MEKVCRSLKKLLQLKLEELKPDNIMAAVELIASSENHETYKVFICLIDYQELSRMANLFKNLRAFKDRRNTPDILPGLFLWISESNIFLYRK